MNTFTKNAIKSSFEELLEKKPLSKITVQQIVDHCGIGRNTFYYHYQDIYMLIEDLLEDRKQELSKAIESMEIDQIADQIVEFLIHNRNIINHVYNSIDIRILEKYLHGIFTDALTLYMQKYIDLDHCDQEEITFTIDFISYAYTGIIMNWFSQGMKEEMLIESVNSIKKHLNAKLIEKILNN